MVLNTNNDSSGCGPRLLQACSLVAVLRLSLPYTNTGVSPCQAGKLPATWPFTNSLMFTELAVGYINDLIQLFHTILRAPRTQTWCIQNVKAQNTIHHPT